MAQNYTIFAKRRKPWAEIFAFPPRIVRQVKPQGEIFRRNGMLALPGINFANRREILFLPFFQFLLSAVFLQGVGKILLGLAIAEQIVTRDVLMGPQPGS